MPRGERFGRELWPPLDGFTEIATLDDLSGPVAVEAGALVVLQLEQLEQLHPMAGRRGDVHTSGWLCEQQSRLGELEELHGVCAQQGQEVDDVEIGDQGVGHVDERTGQ